MIRYNRHELSNGLRILVHEDPNTPLAVCNVLYDVGARDEQEDKTGFAHLFEHLMFEGTRNVPDFDMQLQKAGGSNNAFTSNDITNYYDVLPAQNLETALWLEADRMQHLEVSLEKLDVQRKVVCEEFKEHYINQPYGDVWHKLRALAYTRHPYRWPTIGKELAHIEEAILPDVQAFFRCFYHPANAILAISGGVKTADVLQLVEKWFGGIPAGQQNHHELPAEPPQQEARQLKVEADVPVDMYYRVYHMPARKDPSYYAVDIISDILSTGESSRLYQELVKRKKLFTELDAYITGNIDAGLFVIEGKLADASKMDEAVQSLDREIDRMRQEEVSQRELEKLKNQSESYEAFSNTNNLNKAMKLAYYELLGNANLINEEIELYRAVTPGQVMQEAGVLFREENASSMYYLSKAN